MFKDYVGRFPNSIYTDEAKNAIITMQRKEVYLNYPEVRSSRDSITV